MNKLLLSSLLLLLTTELVSAGNLLHDLDIGSLAVATEARGFRMIPGNSRWSCKRACRDPANGYEVEPCIAACECRQDCPTSDGNLSQECKSQCTSKDEEEWSRCIESCDRECGERCTATFNSNVMPSNETSCPLGNNDHINGINIASASLMESQM